MNKIDKHDKEFINVIFVGVMITLSMAIIVGFVAFTFNWVMAKLILVDGLVFAGFKYFNREV